MEKKQIKTEINVPMDVLLDVTCVMLRAGLKNEITGIKEKKSILEIALYYTEGEKFHQKAMENIGQILEDYNHLRFSEEEENHWTEN
jgi:hypothetical protein